MSVRTARPPRIGVVYNPRSHRNQGVDLEPVRGRGITVVQPATREDLPAELAALANAGLDYLVVNGGDGTVRDVLTHGAALFGATGQPDWPALAVVPKGKTNALNVDLGAPADWSVARAVAAWDTGRRIRRAPLAIRATGTDAPPLLGFIMGAGMFTTGIRAGQDAHRLGAFNQLAVGLTLGWGIGRAVLGGDRNVWRRGVPMRIVPDGGAELERSRHGDPARRAILFASTLARLPVGIRPFAETPAPVRLAVMDSARRRLMAMLPAILAGYRGRWLEEAGFHQRGIAGFALEIGDAFVLDGETFPAGAYHVGRGPELDFVVP